VVPFFTACLECVRGQASRCAKGELYGNSLPASTTDGGQAEYVRCSLADTTFIKTPEGIPEEMLVLMADVFPQATSLRHASSRTSTSVTGTGTPPWLSDVGRWGICAITCALTMVKTVYAIDSVPERLAEAEKIGAKVINLNDDPVPKIKAATEGRGADVVMEVVGHADTLLLALNLIRPWGQISSIGVHTEKVEMSGLILYGKDVTMSFGRCPVHSIFEDALEVPVKEQKKAAFLCGKTMPLEEAPKAYEDFEARKVHKIVFKIGGEQTEQSIEDKVT
jgi:threonine dehydrogenase-like Zn-dependent dehydrogenase